MKNNIPTSPQIPKHKIQPSKTGGNFEIRKQNNIHMKRPRHENCGQLFYLKTRLSTKNGEKSRKF